MEGTSIFKLYGSILVDSSKAEQSIAKTSDKAETMGTKLGRGIKSAAKWGAAIGGAALLVGGAMMGAANKVASTADEIDKASRRAGTSSENWQKLNYAFGQSGIESSKLEQTMIRNQRSLNDAAEGSKTASLAYEKLGVSITGADGKLRASDDVYKDVLNNLADLEDKNLRNSIANDIFGKSYGDLAPILDSGSEGIKELTDRADELGLVMSQDSVDAGVKFGDTLDDVKQAGGKMFVSIAGELLPVLQKFLDWILAHMPEIKEFVSKAFKIIGEVVGFVVDIFKTILPVLTQLYDWVKPYLPAIAKIIKSAFKTIATVVGTVVKVFEKVTGAIEKAWNWLHKWDNTNPKKKNLEVNTPDDDTGYPQRHSKASGLAYVPYDGYKATLHKGERVLNRGEVANLGDGNVTNIYVTGNQISSDYDVDKIGDRIAKKLSQDNRRMPNRTALLPIG